MFCYWSPIYYDWTMKIHDIQANKLHLIPSIFCVCRVSFVNVFQTFFSSPFICALVSLGLAVEPNKRNVKKKSMRKGNIFIYIDFYTIISIYLLFVWFCLCSMLILKSLWTKIGTGSYTKCTVYNYLTKEFSSNVRTDLKLLHLPSKLIKLPVVNQK